jgi:hypothetical protein
MKVLTTLRQPHAITLSHHRLPVRQLIRTHPQFQYYQRQQRNIELQNYYNKIMLGINKKN